MITSTLCIGTRTSVVDFCFGKGPPLYLFSLINGVLFCLFGQTYMFRSQEITFSQMYLMSEFRFILLNFL